jgi:hypothetical protein
VCFFSKSPISMLTHEYPMPHYPMTDAPDRQDTFYQKVRQNQNSSMRVSGLCGLWLSHELRWPRGQPLRRSRLDFLKDKLVLAGVDFYSVALGEFAG